MSPTMLVLTKACRKGALGLTADYTRQSHRATVQQHKNLMRQPSLPENFLDARNALEIKSPITQGLEVLKSTSTIVI